MILQLNDMIGFKDNYWLKQTFVDRLRIDHETYPEQNVIALGKKIHLDHVDYQNGHRKWNRFNITKDTYPEYEGEESRDLDRWWYIVRFDKDYEFDLEEVADETDDDIIENLKMRYTVVDNVVKIPGKAILVGPAHKIIVTSTDKISRMWYYPEYTMDDGEFYLPRSKNWYQFNKERKLDFVHPVPVQNAYYIGMPVMTEYYHDILRYDSIVNRMPESPNQHPTFEQLKEHLVITHPEELTVNKVTGKSNIPDVLLRSFPLYYSRHEHHNLDIPRRAINYGVVIRADDNHALGGDGIVVAEVMEDKSIRYVTGSEAFIYYDTDSGRVDLKDILGEPRQL